MNIKDLEEFRVLIDAVIYAPTKKDAKFPIKKLEFFVSQLNGKVENYLHGVMKTIVNHAKEASGQVKNKDHWVSNVEDNWNYLKMELGID
ncbi:MAG: hypothetical protein KKA76_07555 [Proteobacteria bacterium]|nr:hypothetical protein [Pseudomonadota bacterium]